MTAPPLPLTPAPPLEGSFSGRCNHARKYGLQLSAKGCSYWLIGLYLKSQQSAPQICPEMVPGRVVEGVPAGGSSSGQYQQIENRHDSPEIRTRSSIDRFAKGWVRKIHVISQAIAQAARSGSNRRLSRTVRIRRHAERNRLASRSGSQVHCSPGSHGQLLRKCQTAMLGIQYRGTARRAGKQAGDRQARRSRFQ